MTRSRSQIGLLASILALFISWAAAAQEMLAPPPAPAEAAPAAGASALLAAAEKAPHVVVGRVSAPTRIDRHGWRATLLVERTLHGDPPAGQTLVIAWEELGTKRPARFADGVRVVLALEPLPPGSLWRERFPKGDALAVAARGEAFLRNPDADTLEPLSAWLSVGPAAREDARGVAALAALAARGQPRLATAALRRLDAIPDLADRVPSADTAAKDLAQLFADGARPLDLRRGAFDLAGRRKLVALQPAIEAIASTPSEVQGAAVDALGQLRGGFPVERAAELLRSPDPAVRAAVARRAGEGVPNATLRALFASDPAPAVRAAAATALAAREGPAANDVLIVALRAADSQVRSAAMHGLAAQGAAAVPALREEIWESAPTAEPGRLAGAVLTLALTGGDGLAELRRIVHEHPSQSVRRLATLALGRIEEKP